LKQVVINLVYEASIPCLQVVASLISHQCAHFLAKSHPQCNFKSKKHLSVTDIVLMNFILDQDPELESLSDWVRTIRSLVQGRIHKLKNCVNSRPKSEFKTKKLLSVFPLFMTNMLSFLRTRLPTISYLYVNHITSNA
jgi:hypothetical protein